jgi:hypothetical protein
MASNWNEEAVLKEYKDVLNGDIVQIQPKTSSLGTLLEKAKSKIKVTNG